MAILSAYQRWEQGRNNGEFRRTAYVSMCVGYKQQTLSPIELPGDWLKEMFHHFVEPIKEGEI